MNYALTEEALRKLVCSVKDSKDKHYTHKQTTSSDVWVIEHNLGKHPSVDVVDSAGTSVVGDIQHDSINQVTISFKGKFKGVAYLN